MATTTSKAIIAHDALSLGPWKLETVTVRSPGPGEVLVEMVAAGICHTDVHVGSIPKEAAPGVYPRVLGHEGSGYVKEVGEGVEGVKAGDAVLLSFDHCGKCHFCKIGVPANCKEFMPLNMMHTEKTFTSKDGEVKIGGAFFGQSSFAGYSIVKQNSLVNVSDLVKTREELELLAPLGCGAQTGAGTIINVANAEPQDSVCVMGLGGVGLAAVMAAKIRGCQQIIGIDRVPSRLELAKKLGATDVLDTSSFSAIDKDKAKEAISGLTAGLGPTITIDTAGPAFLVQAGVQSTRPMGKYIQLGAFSPRDFTVNFGMTNMFRGVAFLGATEGWANPQEIIPKMIAWWKEGKFPMEKLVKRFPAEEFERALEEMHSGKVVKPVLCWT